jgi:hypothetical protein
MGGKAVGVSRLSKIDFPQENQSFPHPASRTPHPDSTQLSEIVPRINASNSPFKNRTDL